jgi:hypothetical protein
VRYSLSCRRFCVRVLFVRIAGFVRILFVGIFFVRTFFGGIPVLGIV